MALVALAASFSFADGHMAMYMGVDVHTDGGTWQEVDGRLAQTDASAWLAGATVPMGIQGNAEYSFDVAYLGGLEDNAIGFGAIVPGFLMGLVWDPANLDGSGLHAQVYNAAREIHEYAGITYSFEIPAAMAAGITAEMVMNTPLTVRLRIDSSNGNVWVKDPFDATTWWAFTLGQSLEGEGHNMIGVGTTSAAVSFGNLTATRYDHFSFETLSSIAVGGGGPGGAGSAALQPSRRLGQTPSYFVEGFPAPTSRIEIDPSILQQEPSDSLTLGEVDRIIGGVLKNQGYRYRYFEVDDGFVVATFDRYKCDTGESVGSGFYFDMISTAARALSKLIEAAPGAPLGEIMEHIGMSDIVIVNPSTALFMIGRLVPRLISKVLPDGCYRSIVVVSKRGKVGFDDRKMDYAVIKGLMRLGAKELDHRLRDMEYTDEHKTTVLIYQYHRDDVGVSLIKPGDDRRIEAFRHLEMAGLGSLIGVDESEQGTR